MRSFLLGGRNKPYGLVPKAILEKDRQAAIQAVLADPLTSSLLPLDEIRKMAEEMFKAEKRVSVKKKWHIMHSV